ncbi:MAG TPA: Sec-independent protein translocase protein TatB [Thermoanaerobaculia bacterium]|nr:Sec-independent protein translocase protein TatB [Thermoanaerobaculia bacterium]
MGPLGFPELILIFIVALIVFGPKRLPEIGRMIGKAMGEFKKASDELKNTIEREVRADELKELTTLPKFTPFDNVARSEPAAQTVTVEATPVAVTSETPAAEPTTTQPAAG